MKKPKPLRLKFISDEWSKLTSDQKRKYGNLAKDNEKIYLVELARLKNKGIFIKKHGKDSRYKEKNDI